MSSVQSADSSSVGRGLSSIRLIARAVCMKPKWVKIGCVSMLVSLGCVLVAGVLVLFNWDTLAVQNARYDRVLKRARTLTSHTHETVYFRGDWNFDPAGLPEDNNICARRLQDGSMFVRIGVGSRIFSVDLLPGTNGFTPAVEGRGRGAPRPMPCLSFGFLRRLCASFTVGLHWIGESSGWTCLCAEGDGHVHGPTPLVPTLRVWPIFRPAYTQLLTKWVPVVRNRRTVTATSVGSELLKHLRYRAVAVLLRVRQRRPTPAVGGV